jgi:N6-adenosine-specific RNA methylase IME4
MTAATPSNQYRVIYADPPWTFATYSRKGKGRSAEAYYDCMSLADVKALPVGDWAAGDCVLLLWTTDPLLPTAFEVISAWGFTYKTVGLYWAKLNKHAARVLDAHQPRTLPACDPRPSQTAPLGRAQADCLAAARAQPQARRGL